MRVFAVLLAFALCGCDLSPQEASAAPIPQATPWVRHTMHAGLNGADGVHLTDANGDGRLDIAVAWEESGSATVSLHPGYSTADGAWSTVVVGTSLGPVEDAYLVDVDDDGAVDVITASQDKRVRIHYAPADPGDYLTAGEWATVVLDDSINVQWWMQIGTGDIDGDGDLDIVVGGRNADPAGIYWFAQGASPRTGSDWTMANIGDAGWIMSLDVLDVDGDEDLDIVVTDRTSIGDPKDWTLHGTRGLKNASAGTSWTEHAIGVASNGDPKMGSLVDLDGDGDLDYVDCASNASHNILTTRTNTAGDFSAWSAAVITQPTGGVGPCQDITAADIDGDDDIEYVVTTFNAAGLEGVYWLELDGSRGSIAGVSEGAKWDNVVLYDVDNDGDLDVVTTEQVDNLGLIWYENPSLSPPVSLSTPARTMRRLMRNLMRRGRR